MTEISELQQLADRVMKIFPEVESNITSAKETFEADINTQSVVGMSVIYPFVRKAMDEPKEFKVLCEARGVSEKVARGDADEFIPFVRAVCGEFVSTQEGGTTVIT
tara:strand:- start:314 stop:631 length:318 start_codon:yes stop_codon:yes gene_type:complete